ncbi:MAG: glycosyltransferase family 4 protein [Rubripirellula sp.]
MNLNSQQSGSGQRPKRVLLIGRQFWPHAADSALYLYELACALHRNGVHVEVLTPRYASSWPEEMAIREIAVHRPVIAPRSDWSVGRYVRSLTQWLRTHSESFDVMLVDAIREEAMAAIEAQRSTNCPTVLRCSHWGELRDTHWWSTGRSARRCGSVGKMASAVVAKSAGCQRALLADGFKADRGFRIDNGFASGTATTASSRLQARRNLAVVNSDLATSEETPVVLCTARMTREGGVNLMVRAARHLIAKYPDLRLWFVGDGPHRDWIYESLRADGLRASIAMPGSFCDLSDLLAAADAFVQTDIEGLDSILPSVVSAEIPIVSIDNESTRSILGLPDGDPSDEVQWCPLATAKSFRIGLVKVLDDLPAARTRAVELRKKLVRARPHSASVADYLGLMDQLIRGESDDQNNNNSIKAVS